MLDHAHHIQPREDRYWWRPTGVAPRLVEKIWESFKVLPDRREGGALPELVAGTLGMNANALGAVGLVLTELPSVP